MSLTIKHATSQEQMKTMAILAKANRLYVPGWILKGQLDSVEKEEANHNVKCVSVLYVCGTPIGSAVTRNSGYTHVFIKKAFRRVGYGSILLQSVLRKNKGTAIRVMDGGKGSRKFFRKNGLVVKYSSDASIDR